MKNDAPSTPAQGWREVAILLFAPGEQVVWRYRPQHTPRTVYEVDAEVVQSGLLRVRIRPHDTQGHTLFRWVKPDRLRHKQADEPVRLYPTCRTPQHQRNMGVFAGPPKKVQ